MEQNEEIWGSNKNRRPVVQLIVPVHNEEHQIEEFFLKISHQISSQNSVHYEVIFIDDGSTDKTCDSITQYASAHSLKIRLIRLSRNFGKEAALTAGLDSFDGDAAIPMDVDLQDPPRLLPEMIERWLEGNLVVLAKRIDRKSDTAAKRLSARMFYKVFNWGADIALPEDVGDFRLLDKKVVLAIRSLPESVRFMKGLFAWAGFPHVTVEYAREKRLSGRSSFSFVRLLNLALDGLANFSSRPLRSVLLLGLMVAVASSATLIVLLAQVASGSSAPDGFLTIVFSVLMLGSVQLIALGIIGEYVGKIFIESKRRPAYLVNEVVQLKGFRESE